MMPVVIWGKRILMGVFAGALLAVSSAQALVFRDTGGHWPQETSDVAPDPSVRYGYLKNGIRWALLPGKEGEKGATLRLAVEVGALMETDAESGAAHFLEHMAFNGSKNFPGSTLPQFFRAHGWEQGSSVNAQTTQTATTFSVNLPDTHATDIKAGLQFLSDQAARLTLAQASVDKERPIILAEKKSQEGEASLARTEWPKFLFAGTRLARDVIGTDATIRSLDAQTLRSFYERWYVPSKMTVIGVGIPDEREFLAEVTRAFGDIAVRTAPYAIEVGDYDRSALRIFTHHRPIAQTAVSICYLTQSDARPDSVVRRREQLVGSLIERIVTQRLARQKTAQPQIWTQAGFMDGHTDRLSSGLMFMAVTRAQQWQSALKALYEESERLQRYGVLPAEFEQAKKDELASRARQVINRRNLGNALRADIFALRLAAGSVYTSAAQDEDFARQELAGVTVEEVSARAKTMFAHSLLRLQVSGGVKTTPAEVAGFWSSLQRETVSAPAATQSVQFPYLPAPKAVGPVSFTTKSWSVAGTALTAHQAALPNGVQLVLLPLSFEKGKISASVVFGAGKSALAEHDVPVALAAQALLQQTRVGALSQQDTRELFTQSGVHAREAVMNTYNAIYGSAPRDQAGTLLEVLRTMFLDGQVNEQDKTLAAADLADQSFARTSSVPGVASYEREGFFTGNPARMRPLDEAQLKSISLAAIQAYLTQARAMGPRIVVVAGDIDLAVMKAQATRVFASLPSAAKPHAPAAGKAAVFPAKSAVQEVAADHFGKAMIFSAWPMPALDPADRKMGVINRIAATILRNALRQTVREKLGAAYGPAASYLTLPEEGGFSYMITRVETTLGGFSEVQQAIDQLSKDLAGRTITSAELEDLRRPMIAEVQARQKSNQYWYAVMLQELRTGLPYMRWHTQDAAEIEAVTAQEVTKELQRIFREPHVNFIVRSIDAREKEKVGMTQIPTRPTNLKN